MTCPRAKLFVAAFATIPKSQGFIAGANLRPAGYTADNLNRYTSRDVPAGFDVIGLALATNSVTVNGQTPYRHGEYFRKEITVDNNGAAVWQSVTVSSPNETTVTGNVFVPKTQEQFAYDDDGNLTQDGHWNYGWDAENRLVALTNRASATPAQVLHFEYDSKSRRIRKQVWSNADGSGSPDTDLRFVYDGWNLTAELPTPTSALRAYTWGLDLSGSMQGAGGIGGLVELTYSGTQTTNCFAGFDGNGNLMLLADAANGTAAAQYEFGPFGEVIRATGALAPADPFRFSTKYVDSETDLLYYGYRYCNAATGRWLNRDPLHERAGNNLFASVFNRPPLLIDPLGLDPRSGGQQLWVRDVLFHGTKIGTAEVWIHTQYRNGDDAIWLQFNKGQGAPECKWAQFVLRNIYDPEGQRMENEWYNVYTIWRLFGERYLDNITGDWYYEPYENTETYYAIGDQPDARYYLTENRPTVVGDFQDFLICRNQGECSGGNENKWEPAFQVSWRETQRYTSVDTLAYEVTRGESITTLPHWAQSPAWLCGFQRDHKTARVALNPTL